MAYRGGYLPAERREIERRLFAGELAGCHGHHGARAGSGYRWAGGRGDGRLPGDDLEHLAADGARRTLHGGLAGGPDRPRRVRCTSTSFTTPTTWSALSASGRRSTRTTASSLRPTCSAPPMSYRSAKAIWRCSGPKTPQLLELLGEAGYLTRRARWYWTDPDTYPAGEISIRSASGGGYDILDVSSGALLGTMDSQSAQRMVHQGAVYLHGGGDLPDRGTGPGVASGARQAGPR